MLYVFKEANMPLTKQVQIVWVIKLFYYYPEVTYVTVKHQLPGTPFWWNLKPVIMQCVSYFCSLKGDTS